MRNDLQLIQSAIASIDLTNSDIDRLLNKESTFITLYAVRLPKKFKGLPSIWFFGILPDQGSIDDDQRIIGEANSLIRDLIKEVEIPIVFISDDQRIHFGDELSFNEQPVFFLDKFELPGKDNFSKNVKQSPILLSARRKFKNSEVSYYLSPYSPNTPVNGWRFFGRKKEIRDIIESRSNYFVIGARRIGKTSLLQEIRRQLKKKGENVYWIECQYAEKIQDVMDEIAKNLSYRDYHQIQHTGKNVDFNFLTTVLKRLKGDQRNLVLIFDEIGNVIAKNFGNDSWRFIGALREISHNSEVRIVASAFQEIIHKQMSNPEGPFVNFGTNIKINSFTNDEIEDLLISPLNFWGKLRGKKDLANKIRKNFGAHPLILQYLGKRVFELLIKDEEKFIDDAIDEFFIGLNLSYFEAAVTDIYFKIGYLERYLFLRFCVDIDSANKEIATEEIKQNGLKTILDNIGIESDLDSRMSLLERLSLRGLLAQDISNKSIYKIDCPVVYSYLKKFHSVHELLQEFLDEIKVKKLTPNHF
jgi:AAA domain